jgi:hypothetical protein
MSSLMKKCLLSLLAFLLLSNTQAQEDSTAASPPGSLLSFQVQAVEKIVLLKWIIEKGWEYKSFEIERANDGINFIKVGSRLGISKNSEGGFDFVDATPEKGTPLYYRLKMISIDGLVSYSENKETKIADVQWAVRLKQNPVRNAIELEIDAAKARQTSVAVVSNAGQQFITRTFRLTVGKTGLTLSSQELRPGLYQLIVQIGNDRKTMSFIKE